MKRIYTSIIFSLLFVLSSIGQDITVGLISYDADKAFPGYTLIYPHFQSSVYLLNNCGEIVHEWTDDEMFVPGNSAYLLESGNLVKAKRAADKSNDPIWGGGGGAIVEILTWDNQVLWSYELNDETGRLHHDIEIMPNGNIMMIAWANKTRAEAIAAGRDTSLLRDGKVFPDFLREINPNTDEIVWEWHVWDHLVQDYDPTVANYGVVSENPGKIDINYGLPNGQADWIHANSVDYHPDLDQVMISVPHFNEIWFIDHSTTTAEAATDSGGNAGVGGELICRLGNPAAYDMGTADDQTLFFQHDAHWNRDLLSTTDANYDNIVLYNNRIPGGYSAVENFPLEYDADNGGYAMDSGTWLPHNLENTIYHPDTFGFSSIILSSGQFLPNGNILVCSGRNGYIAELTEENEVVWEYITPVNLLEFATQGDTLPPATNLTFRADRYPEDFIAFEGKDLSTKGYIELNPNTEWCNRLVSNPSSIQTGTMKLHPNPVSNVLNLQWENISNTKVDVINLQGRRLMSAIGNNGAITLDVGHLQSGLYLVHIEGQSSVRFIKQ